MAEIESVDDVIAEVARSGAWYQLLPGETGRHYYYGQPGDTSRPAPNVIGLKLQGRVELVSGPGSTPSYGTVVATGRKPRTDSRGYQQKYGKAAFDSERDMRRCLKCRKLFDSKSKGIRRCKKCHKIIEADRNGYFQPRLILKGVQ